jgi:soluble lytic murein transglycosylase-like protein
LTLRHLRQITISFFENIQKNILGHRFKAQGIAESMLAPDAQSWCGAKGIMQIMPGTFKDICRENSWIKSIDDPEQNIASGISYDQKLYLMWSGPRPEVDRMAFMLGAYNAGAGNILKAQKLCNLTRIYGRVLRLWRSRSMVGKVLKR